MADLDISTDNKRQRFVPPRPAGSESQRADTVRILIPKTKDATGDVPVGVNGTVWLIKRGVPVDVPKAVVEVLTNAKGMEYDQVVDPVTGRKELVPQETMSYPFQYV